jgi:hypothetical protein
MHYAILATDLRNLIRRSEKHAQAIHENLNYLDNAALIFDASRRDGANFYLTEGYSKHYLKRAV